MNYKNGKVYQIVNDINNEIYVGSTCQPLSKRLSWHKADSKKERTKNMKIYKLMNELGQENFRIVLLENCSCNNRDELNAREEHYRKELKPSLNIKRCYLTDDDKINLGKEYRINNADKIKTFKGSVHVCDICGVKYTHAHKSRHERTKRHQKAINK